VDPIDIQVKAVRDRPESGEIEDEVRQSTRLYRHADLAVTAGLAGEPGAVVRFSSSEDEMFAVTFKGNVTLGLLPPPYFANRQDERTAAGGRR